MKRQSQQGVALVITLILLSVITFMAVTFLVVSRKEASSVNTLTQQANAKFASEAGLEEAKAQIVAQMLATTNGLNFGLLVSTNYEMTNFATDGGIGKITNVSYVNVSSANLPQLMNNLQILPRVPVFISTNKDSSKPLDFRFYLDLNRNARYDTNGQVVELDPTDPSGTKFLTNVYTGDPEWVGILNHPDQRHSSSNQFVARYCFIALPIGNSLDLNFIHNQSKQTGNAWDDGYLRNQGVGTWEINLAAFLHTLNPNWDNEGTSYAYATNNGTSSAVSKGTSFDDATAILQYRYNFAYNNLRSVNTLFGANGILFTNDIIDWYSSGPLMTGLFPPTFTIHPGYNKIGTPWSGDDNINKSFTTQDLFTSIPYPLNNPANAGSSFSNHLFRAGRNFHTGNPPYFQNGSDMTNSFNRYTFYRMLAQMSVGSAPESSFALNANVTFPFTGYYPFTNRLNLNYCNVGGLTATNFQPWGALQFFTNAANRLLFNAGFTNTVANIPIYPVNLYTPAMHRLLQLAANIYDASANRYTNTAEGIFYYPSVFRPTFTNFIFAGITNVYINGYVEDMGYSNEVAVGSVGLFTGAFTANPLSLPEQLSSVFPTTNVNGTTNIYGIPWVIGARKGFPNFNEFSMASISQITRKIELVNLQPGSAQPLFQTNLQYTIGVSNVLGIEAWNSYSNNYGRAIDLTGSVISRSTVSVLNTNGSSNLLSFSGATNGWQYTLNPAVGNPWLGSVQQRSTHQFNTSSLQVPISTNVIFLTNSVYHQLPSPRFSISTNFDVPASFAQPHFILSVTNYVRYIVQDHATGRIIDYVTLNGLSYLRDLTAELPGTDGGGNGQVWVSDAFLTGIKNQIKISANLPVSPPFNSSGWINDTLQGTTLQNAQAAFGNFLNGQGGVTNSMQAPYTPTRKVEVGYTFQANDPFVHYTLGDLTWSNNVTTNYPSLVTTVNTNYLLTAPASIGQINPRYLPWNNNGNLKGAGADGHGVAASDFGFKDPQITNSDAWQFPSNKFPNIGWLGRVHRGTPWQTVYLKAPSTTATLNTWQTWTGDLGSNFFPTLYYSANSADALMTLPTNDWQILDLFTTAPNDNASRGQLSVNQTNAAAWAAVLEGVIAVANGPNGPTPVTIDHNTNQLALSQIINGIYQQRTNALLFPGQVFTSIGQILSAPQLTTQSPYLNLTVGSSSPTYPNDAEMERIPQQIMSLLRVGSPRYVIFAYGQSLKPAEHSIVQGGPFFGICTNYAITGEVASRTVLRIDNPPIPGRTPGSPQAIIESFNVIPPE